MSTSAVDTLMLCMHQAFACGCSSRFADSLARTVHSRPELQDALSKVITDWVDTVPEMLIKKRSTPFNLTVKGELVSVTAISFADARGGIEDGDIPLWAIEKLGGSVLDVGDTSELDVGALCSQLDEAGLDTAYFAALYVCVDRKRRLVYATHYPAGWNLVTMPECEPHYATHPRGFYLVTGLS